MTSDDARIGELLSPLQRLEAVPFDVGERRDRRWFQRPVLVAAIAGLALALTVAAIANSLGAFTGISFAYGPQTPGALKWARHQRAMCRKSPSDPKSVQPPWGDYRAACHFVLSSARLLSAHSKIYIVTDTHGELCYSFAVSGQGDVSGFGCGPPLTASRPISMSSFAPVGDRCF